MKSKIDPAVYVPKPPDMPIPKGLEDCFGKYPDPDSPVCKGCDELENCIMVRKYRIATTSPRFSRTKR